MTNVKMILPTNQYGIFFDINSEYVDISREFAEIGNWACRKMEESGKPWF